MFHVKHNPPHVLLLNPWITDFAAYNLWIKPLGLLYLGSTLVKAGYQVSLIDCLEHSIKSKPFGDGKFFKKRIDKPEVLRFIPRNYSQYGITEEMLLYKLSNLKTPPDIICMSSGMTYWYPGVIKLVEIVKKLFKDVPIILGGIYATLCYEHAVKFSGADYVFKGGDLEEALKLISKISNFTPRNNDTKINKLSNYPSFNLYNELKFVCILSSKGCPFNCTYCASPFLTKEYIRRDPLEVADEIEYWVKGYGIENIAFYDDALLIEPKRHFIPLAEQILKKGIRCNFHTPNALHIREIDQDVAELLFKSNFKTIRLGLETSDESFQIETGGKVKNQEFLNAIKYLNMAGYEGNEIGVYVMAGLPGQILKDVEESIFFVRKSGAKPILVEYSPIPHTPMFEKAKRFSKFDLENEPLFHNNSIFPCEWDGFTKEDFVKLKERLKRGEI